MSRAFGREREVRLGKQEREPDSAGCSYLSVSSLRFLFLPSPSFCPLVFFLLLCSAEFFGSVNVQVWVCFNFFLSYPLASDQYSPPFSFPPSLRHRTRLNQACLTGCVLSLFHTHTHTQRVEKELNWTERERESTPPPPSLWLEPSGEGGTLCVLPAQLLHFFLIKKMI